MDKIRPSVIDDNNKIVIVDAEVALRIAAKPKIKPKQSSIEASLRKENEELRKMLEEIKCSKAEVLELEELKKKIKELEEIIASSPSSPKNITLSSLINEERKKADSKGKLAIFKKIIEENKILRN